MGLAFPLGSYWGLGFPGGALSPDVSAAVLEHILCGVLCVCVCVCVCWGGSAGGCLWSAGSAGVGGKDALFSTWFINPCMAEAHCNILRGKGYSNITWASWGSRLQARNGMIRCRWAADGSEVVMKWNLWTLCSVLALSLSMPPIPILFPPTKGNVTFLPHFPLVNPDNHTSCTPHWGSIRTDELLVKALRDTVEIYAVQIGTMVIDIGVLLFNRCTGHL